MAGKGDRRRPEDNQAFRDNYDRIFGNKGTGSTKESSPSSPNAVCRYCGAPLPERYADGLLRPIRRCCQTGAREDSGI